MKLSEVKKAIADAAKQNKEALGEVGKRIDDLNKQIKDLVEGNSDPDVTDEQFTADLKSLQDDARALADIVPGPDAPPEPTPA